MHTFDAMYLHIDRKHELMLTETLLEPDFGACLPWNRSIRSRDIPLEAGLKVPMKSVMGEGLLSRMRGIAS